MIRIIFYIAIITTVFYIGYAVGRKDVIDNIKDIMKRLKEQEEHMK